MKAAAKREKEKQVIQEMISLYCRKQHHGQSLCKECQTLCRYAHQRIDCCPFMKTRPSAATAACIAIKRNGVNKSAG